MKLRVTTTVTRITLTILLVVLCAVRVEPVAADLDHHVYLPRVARNGCYKEPGMSDWKLIVPEATTNWILNSSLEFSTWNQNWANAGGNPPASADETGAGNAKFGLHSAEVTFGGANSIFGQDLIADKASLDGQQMTISAWVRTSGTDVTLVIQADNSSGTGASAAHSGSGEFERLSFTVTPNFDDGGVTTFIVVGVVSQTNLLVAYFDACQLELKSEATTYCDGDQPGCEWLGLAHDSTSQRSAQSRAGGFIRDFKTDYGFGVSNFMNTGMPTQSTEIDNYALLQGGQLNDIKVEPREFTLMGILSVSKIGDCTKSLDELRAALEEELAHDRYPEGPDGWQPLLIRYTGADVDKEIAAHYSGGLEGRIALENQIQESMGLRFAAPDPNWYEIGQSAQLLDTEDGPTLRYITARLRSTGQWDDLGLTANPTANGIIYAVLEASDRTVYVGGNFTGLDGIGGRDFFASYDVSTDTWSTVGPGGEFNNVIYTIAEASNGDIYVGGEFTDGVGNKDFISRWDGTNWNAVGNPTAGGATIARVWDLVFGLDGTLYVGGDFTNWTGIALGDGIVSWSGVAYAALADGFNAIVRTVAIGIDGTLYAGGTFTFSGAIPINRAAQWDGSAWTALYNSSGFNSTVEAITVRSDGTVYAGGTLTSVDGVTIRYISEWNGQVWSQLGSGLVSNGANSGVSEIAIGADDILYAVGRFTPSAISVSNDAAKWNGSSWAHLDLDLPGAPIARAVAVGFPDPVLLGNYDLWIGFDTTGVAAVAGSAAITNEGTAHALPKFVVSRSGGTSAILKAIRNETIARELLYDYSLLDLEELTTFNDPLLLDIQSTAWGQRLDATLAGDDFGDWSLQPGDNQVTCFVENNGATVVGYLLYRTAYKGHSD